MEIWKPDGQPHSLKFARGIQLTHRLRHDPAAGRNEKAHLCFLDAVHGSFQTAGVWGRLAMAGSAYWISTPEQFNTFSETRLPSFGSKVSPNASQVTSIQRLKSQGYVCHIQIAPGRRERPCLFGNLAHGDGSPDGDMTFDLVWSRAAGKAVHMNAIYQVKTPLHRFSAEVSLS